MENFYDRINGHFPDDGKYHENDLIKVDMVKGYYYLWMEDIFLKLDELKTIGHNSETIDMVKQIINSKTIHSQ